MAKKAKQVESGLEFVEVEIDKVRCYWVCINDECKQFGKTDFYIHPSWHENNGTPVCDKCDRDMHFDHVEVAI